MTTRLVRAMAWLYAAALVYLSLGPTAIRLATPMPLSLEHMAAFGLSGLLFAIAYRCRAALVAVGGLGFAAVLEGLQIWAPGRHARLLDLASNALGFCIGMGVGLVIARSAGK